MTNFGIANFSGSLNTAFIFLDTEAFPVCLWVFYFSFFSLTGLLVYFLSLVGLAWAFFSLVGLDSLFSLTCMASFVGLLDFLLFTLFSVWQSWDSSGVSVNSAIYLLGGFVKKSKSRFKSKFTTFGVFGNGFGLSCFVWTHVSSENSEITLLPVARTSLFYLWMSMVACYLLKS